jgi:hypothetical protein
VFQPADGSRPAPVETVMLSIYAEEQGGSPLWQETQTVAIDAQGRYTLLLGATHGDGIPPSIFAAGDAQWLGTTFNRAGEAEGPRVRLTSVPYALRADNADTLGGLPASAYVLTPSARKALGAAASDDAMTAAMEVDPQAVLPGTTNFLAKYVNAADVASSGVFEDGTGKVAIGTTTPFDFMHVKFANTTGQFTGLAVQNTGNTATSFSGMLFFDQNNALGQFQGFNNVTHEYRINNIARNGASQFDGSINFMIGSTSRFFINSVGQVGIGTATPVGQLEVSNGSSGTSAAILHVSSFSPGFFGSTLVGRTARGTAAAPAAVQNNDALLLLTAQGRGTTNYADSAFIAMRAAQTFTDTARGTAITFATTPLNAAVPIVRMTVNAAGNVGIGTSFPQSAVDVLRNGDAEIVAKSFGNGDAKFEGYKAGGTAAAPTAVQAGDSLVELLGGGHTGTTFVDERGGMAVIAAEDWTDTAQGTALIWGTTPLGDTEIGVVMAMLPNGNLGVGTGSDVNGSPIALDRLHVAGDVRVANCVKNSGGTQIAGTCPSDARYKKDITPFGPVLARVAALQPVHYYWRAAEYADRHFGTGRTYGLIAQEVEQVLPELVVTGEDGYKAVDYSKLPLLAVQAIKELQAENETLKSQVAELEPVRARVAELEPRVAELEPLKARLSELERLLNQLLSRR